MQSREARDYREFLREELAKRVDRNPRYSLRSFAKMLEVTPGVLSLILSGRRGISTRVVSRILNRLELSAVEKHQFLNSILEEKKLLGLQRISPKLKTMMRDLELTIVEQEPSTLGSDEFRIIADWYHYAILELTSDPAFRTDAKWIAKQLEITELEAKLAVDRLLKLRLLQWEGDRLLKTNRRIDTKDKAKTSEFHRRRQRQILEKSIESLENDPIQVRNHSAITVNIAPEKLEEAKARIQKFMWELSAWMTEVNPSRVYEMSVALFPLQKETEVNEA